MTARYALFPFCLIIAALPACGSQKSDPATRLAKELALREEFTTREEAIVWLYDRQGNTSTHWIRNDAAGIEVIASRDELLIPTPGALWRPELDDIEEDFDVVELRDLVSKETMRIVLDENAVNETSSEETPDAGLPEDTASPASDAGQEPPCVDDAVQGRPALLATIGPVLFLKFEERLYSCDDALRLVVDRYLAFDVSKGEPADLFSDTELTALYDREDLDELERVGEVTLDGVVPFFSPAFDLSLTYSFTAKSTFESEDGEPQSIVSSLEISATALPESLAPYAKPPDIARTFSLMIPGALPGGWWSPEGTEEELEKQLTMFLPPDITP